MKAKDLLSLVNNPSILFYGPAGSGKTGLVSQAKNSYMFDFDGGMRTAALMEDKFTPLRYECEFDTYVDDRPEFPKMWNKAVDKILEFSKLSAAGKLPYDCIIIDSLTGMAKCMQLQIMVLAGGSFKKPQIQHWGDMVNEMEKALTILRSLKCLLLVTAHESVAEVDGINLVRPMSVTEKHGRNKLAWLFDEVLHTKLRPAGAGKHKYTLSGSETTSIMARTRSRMKGEFDFTEAGLEEVLEKIGYTK